MYCWNYKVASSFLMALMFKSVTNGSELELGIQPWTLQNSMSPRTMAEWRLGAGAGANILVVRHPMVRLVSAYRDRIEGLKASLRIYQHIDRGESNIHFEHYWYYPYLQCLVWTGRTATCGEFRQKVSGARRCLRSTSAGPWRCPAGGSLSGISCSRTS